LHPTLDGAASFPESLRVFKRTGQLLLTLALIAAIGGHWAVLQTVAWTTMLAGNLRDVPLAVAVEKTFDGKHPCALCKQISAGKKSENKSEFQFGLKKLEFTHRAIAFHFSPPQHFRLTGERHRTLRALALTPPLPPPRSILPG
jgi:hypothetical protein